MMPKRRKLTHPGKILQEDFLKPLGLTARQFAEMLGKEWDEITVESIIRGKTNLSSDAIHQFAKALGTTPDLWQCLQQTYSQWEETHRQNEKGSLKPWKRAQ